jgi:cytochrome P450
MNAQINLMAPEFRANPYPFYAEMRRKHPVQKVEPGGLWAVSRFDDVERVLKTPELFAQGFRAAWQPDWLERENPLASSILALDDPAHARLRTLVTRSFGARAVARLEPRIRDRATALAGELASRGEADFIAGFALPLPGFAIAELLGIEGAPPQAIKRWADDLVRISPVPESPAQAARARGTIEELTGYFADIIAARRRAPADDMVSDLVHAGAGGQPLTDAEIISFMAVLLLGGFDTTTYLLANALLFLAQRPDEGARLRATPALVPAFIEEMLRYDAPVHGVPRVATADVEVAGVTIPRGSLVLALLGSANRDEGRFDDPDRFDIERGRPGLAFGHGIHFCLGATLARMEAHLSLLALLTRFRAFACAPGELEWNRSLTVRGMKALPLRFIPA